MIPLRPTKKTSSKLNREDLRVLMNLSDINPVLGAKFLTNKKPEEVALLLDAYKNEEVASLYNFMVR